MMKQPHIALDEGLGISYAILPGDPARAKLPTEERLKLEAQGSDPAFAKLVFDYGRYLLQLASRP